MELSKPVDDFLRKYGMHYDTIDMQDCMETFIEEMDNGLAGKNSSLKMLPTYITLTKPVDYDRPVIVMDAGGTNFRIAVLTLKKDDLDLIEHFQKFPMPGTQGKSITKEEFFDQVAQHLLPVIELSDTIAWCYSYAAEIFPNHDGLFLGWNKEVQISGMEGCMLGAELNKALAKYDIAAKKIVILNDTVAAMLGGMTVNKGQPENGLIGLILGTGFNTCYLEDCHTILKSTQAVQMTGQMGINMESPYYLRFPRGQFDQQLDAQTNNPGSSFFEKMVAGAYQGSLLYLTLEQAVADGLLSESVKQQLSVLFPDRTIPLWDVNEFLDSIPSDGVLFELVKSQPNDKQYLQELLEANYERSARLVAINLAAILVKTKQGRDEQNPACITAEGTTFQKSPVFREKLSRYVETFLNEKQHVYCQFLSIENSTLLGSAIAGLML